MANKVELDSEGYIYQKLKSDMTAKDLEEDLPKILELEKQLIKKGLPIKLLLDVSSKPKADTDARKAGVANLKKMNFEKLAIYGINPYLKYVIVFVLSASGQGDKIKAFKDERQARDWLEG